MTDPKGEIFSKTSKLFKDNGYNIYTIDFRNPNLSNRINIMQPIINEWKLHCSSNNKLFICMCYLYEKLKIDYDLFVSNESYRNEIKLKNKIDNYIIDIVLLAPREKELLTKKKQKQKMAKELLNCQNLL